MKSTTIALRNLDPQRGGRAELRIDEPEFVPAQLSVSIRRGSATRSFLGPDGWQQSEHLFRAESFGEDRGGLVIVLGPDVVDNELRDFEVVEMTFPEVGMAGQVSWEGITRTVSMFQEPIPPSRNDEPPPLELAEAPPIPDAPPTPLPAEPQQETPVVVPKPPPRGGRIAVALVALLVAAAGVYYVADREPTPPPPPVDPQAGNTGPGSSTPQVEGPDPARPAPSPAQAAFDRARSALAAGDCEAAANGLREATSGGLGAALLFAAQQQDSVDFQHCIFQSANDVRALDNYLKACEAGEADAKPAVQALAEALKRRADAGDTTAAEVLRLKMPKIEAACSD